MKITTYHHPSHGSEPVAGVLQGDRVLRAGALLGESTSLSVLALLERGPEALTRLSAAADAFRDEHAASVHVPRDIAVPAWEATFSTPLPNPPSIRDFYAFEQHVAVSYTRRGREIPSQWFEAPVFYFAHTGNLFGSGESIPTPAGSRELDFELELAAVIGLGGRDIAPADAWRHIAGFMVMNDWSARDLQRQEMALGLGPAKGKDFATSFGPVLVTTNELVGKINGNVIDVVMTARVNGEPVSRDSSASMHWTFPDLVARASQQVDLRPGDIIGSGTCGTGCIFELGPETVPWLQPGDEVELEIEGIGRLRNVIAD